MPPFGYPMTCPYGHEIEISALKARIRELERAAQVEAMGWRPIEEAPKDGTHFIGLIGGLPYDVHCREYIEGWKETGKDGWVSSGKRVHVFCKETDESIMPCKPTHWIPLPPPPVTP